MVKRSKGELMMPVNDDHMDESFKVAEMKPMKYPVDALAPVIMPEELMQKKA